MKRIAAPSRRRPLSWVGLALVALAVWLVWPGRAAADDEGNSGVSPQVISLPSGPGSLEGLGESFEPELSTGTAGYPFKLSLPPGVAGFQPEVTLTYDGGNPNGPWGLGWSLSVACIQRRTDAGLPTYDDARDRFIFRGEKLTAVAGGFFRLENEGEFTRFRRLAGGGWEAHTPDGRRWLYGATAEGRVANEHGVFRWCLQKGIDTHGNEIDYLYRPDRGNLYLDEIRYNFSGDGRHHSVRFHYEPRPDVFTDRASRARITTAWRGTEIQVWAFGRFVRAYRLGYTTELSTGRHSLLATITPIGDDGLSALPPTTFTYTEANPAVYRVVSMTDPPPIGLTNPDADLVDINYDGLPDVVHTAADGPRFYLNRGRGRWQAQPLRPADAPGDRLSSPGARLADMNGDGHVDLLVKAGASSGAPFYYYAATPGRPWAAADRVDYNLSPAFALDNPNVRFMDANNDKRIDIVQSGPALTYVWLAHDDDTWSETADFITATPAIGTPLTFDNPRVKLGDMTGDRLQDLVFVRDGLVRYFPSLGNGLYDDGVTMAGPPQGVGQSDTRIQVGDLNNDGLDDLVLPDNRSVTYWLNLGDNTFAAPVVLGQTPALTADTAVRLADMDGDGGVELLFSRYPAAAAEIAQYVDFSTVTQPHLLRSIDNGLGRTYLLDYRPSTDFYTAAWDAGRPWATSLPFPVQLLERATTFDANSGQGYVTDYSYSDGYYDGAQKEFRGFAAVTKTERGDDTAATTVTVYRYDVGAAEESRKGLVLEQTVLGEGGQCAAPVQECYRREVNEVTTRHLFAGVAYSYVAQTDTTLYENQPEPVHLRQTFTQDDFGNVTETFDYGQVCGEDVGCGADERLKVTQYALNVERWIVNLPAVVRQTDVDGGFVSEERHYYDGEPYVGLPLGQVVRGDLSRQESDTGPTPENAPPGQRPAARRFIATKRQAFDAYGNVVGIRDANGNLTTISYDALSHTFPVAEYVHLGEGRRLAVAAVYHPGFGQITAATDYNGNVSRYTYDPFGRLSRTVLPGDTLALPTYEYRYELGSPRSRITTLSRERSGEATVRRSVTYYDGLGRALQTRREAEDGRVVVESAKLFNARQGDRHTFLPYYDDTLDYAPPLPVLPHDTQLYDPLARVVRQENPDGTFTSTVYRPLSEAQYDEEDNTSGSPHFDTPHTFTYDGLERLVGVDEVNVVAGGREVYHTAYGYDLLDNLTRVVDAAGNVKTMRYDGLSRKVYLDDPDRGEMFYTYDDAGNLVETLDARGQTVRYTYDAANRLTAERWLMPGGALHDYARYHYDDARAAGQPAAHNTLGQISYIEDEAGRLFYSYDARGNKTAEARHFTGEATTFVTGLSYDATNRLASVTYPDGATIAHVYNAQGLLESIPGFVTDIDYMASGQREQMTYGNGVVVEYAYDNRLRLRTLAAAHGATVLQDLTYDFDGVSNVLSVADGRPGRTLANDQTQQFTYDALYRLTGAAGTYGTIAHEYDRLGNMTRQTSTAADARLNLGQLRYGEDGAGPHAVTWADEAYRYDANGNLSARGDTRYTWDYRDRLRAVAGDGLASSYVYDFAGQRAIQTTAGDDGDRRTLYLGQYADIRDGQMTRYVWVDDQRVAQVTAAAGSAAAAETLWTLVDHLGGTSLQVDAQGQVRAEVVYYPFGLTRYESGAADVAYRFTGKELDASGLYYYEARYYHAAAGAFISADPLYTLKLDEGLRNPQELNPYRYGLNNPVRFTDPTGQSVWDTLKAVGQKAAALSNEVATIVGGLEKVTFGAGLSGTGVGAAVGAPIAAMGVGDVTLAVARSVLIIAGKDPDILPESTLDAFVVLSSQSAGHSVSETETARGATALAEGVAGKYSAGNQLLQGNKADALLGAAGSASSHASAVGHFSEAGRAGQGEATGRTSQRGLEPAAKQPSK